MNYKTRPGIVKVKICGVFLLIPTHPAAKYCKSIKKLSFISAMVWDMLENNKSIEDIYKAVYLFTKKDRIEIEEKINRLLQDMYSDGYLIEETNHEEI